MQRPLLCLCLALAMLGSVSASAQVARPSDRAVEDLMEEMEKSIKEFERSLDSKLRRGTIRGETTEVDVENYLDDFETDIERLRDRFDAKYSASSELLSVLRKANGVDKFVKSQPPSFKGRSEWDVAAAVLNDLAAAYGAMFPTPENAAVRRINDAEIQEAADAVNKQAQAYRKDLKGAFAKEESDALKAAQKSADELSSAAKSLKSRVKSGKPASGEAGVVGEKFAAAQAAAAGRTLPEKAAAAWKGVASAVDKIDQAFGASRPAAANPPAS